MKKKLALLSILTFLVFNTFIPNMAFAADDFKVAIVDVQTVVENSQQVKNLKKEQETKLKDLAKWIETVNSDINKQKSEDGKKKLTAKYNAEYSKKKEAIAKDYAAKLNSIDANITATINSVAKAKGYNLVLTKPIVLFGGDDITAEVSKVIK